MTEQEVDILIIGAGPSGSVAAAYSHQQGFNVKVVEKSKFPRFAIGESLLPRCMEHFEEVGLLDSLKAQNFQIKKGARFLKEGKSCHFDFKEKHTNGWDWTWQVPRAEFDKTLTDELQKKGVPILFETEVTGIRFRENGTSKTTVINPDGKEQHILAKHIIDASGPGRVIPKLLNQVKPTSSQGNAAIFTHIEDINRPNGEEGTLITFDVVTESTWLWVIPFSNGKTSIGFVGPSEFIDSFSGSTSEKLRKLLNLSNHYYKRFENNDFLFDPKHFENFSSPMNTLYGNGYTITGNSAGFLDPVFSSGVTFATESGLLAAKLTAKKLRGQTIDWEKGYENHLKQGVSVFKTYVDEWYSGNLQKIFFAKTINPEIKKQICSVLAGYVWDTSNPFVKNHQRLVNALAKVIEMDSDG
ncbi:NAD(P)/FAD-dependent oxidoreductase [Marixanthomonas spongiae]|uniref:Pyridine nucleotide-disulfide oxidoreductase n=1 Tax=Marixanthomonas spongiae TaxID=2174845 RepID=A0A2U0HZK7_9FLAO|nr:NAD(P)/FAD-dependent oxidoreductase [Marixanthomonas spongiae]PVW14305.1 pyridine nucleotide-disulfide oxidoreductase [Marixanthomonas spongiae]